jgi:hypothetical protein
MPPYPVTIRRCQHIKVNGVQCGSPAQRNEMHCFFHEKCRLMSRQINMKFTEHGIITLPTLEDANSIQLGLAELMRLLVTQQIDQPTASLLLRVLRTAVSNLKFLSLEPKPTHIVIDPKCVEDRPLGATAWSTAEGREYDIIEEEPDTPSPQDGAANIRRLDEEFKKDKLKTEIRLCQEAIRQRLAHNSENPPEQSPAQTITTETAGVARPLRFVQGAGASAITSPPG